LVTLNVWDHVVPCDVNVRPIVLQTLESVSSNTDSINTISVDEDLRLGWQDVLRPNVVDLDIYFHASHVVYLDHIRTVVANFQLTAVLVD